MLSYVDSACSSDVIFDKNLSFAQHISAVSKSCFHNIRDQRRIRNVIDKTTACTIATSLIHSKIDYCNSLLLILPATQKNRLQLVLNSAARAVTKIPKFHHITPILKSFTGSLPTAVANANGCIQLQQMLHRQPRTSRDCLRHSSNTR